MHSSTSGGGAIKAKINERLRQFAFDGSFGGPLSGTSQ
jgi:hypothetical protein